MFSKEQNYVAYAAENKWQRKREPWGRGQARHFVTHSSSGNNKISPFFLHHILLLFQTLFLSFFLETITHLTNFNFCLNLHKKSARDNLERYCGWFLVHCFSKKFQRMAREAMDVCLRGLKESNKRRFDSYSVNNKCIDYIPYYLLGLSRAQFLRQPFSK